MESMLTIILYNNYLSLCTVWIVASSICMRMKELATVELELVTAWLIR